MEAIIVVNALPFDTFYLSLEFFTGILYDYSVKPHLLMTIQREEKTVAIIPARYASTRFPGKPLIKILGKTLIQRTYENTLLCQNLTDVIVATDDQRIFDHVQSFGGKVVMTGDCATGTDRLVEVVKKEINDFEIILNIQGDEPCLDPHVIDQVVRALVQSPNAVVSTAAMKITSQEEALSPSNVKCVLDKEGYALYFSRALIPSNKTHLWNPETVYYKHLGIYCYRKEFLLKYGQLSQTALQQAEDLEQLKILEHGYKIKVALVESQSVGVDNPEDIKKVEQLLCKQNSSL